MTRPVMLTTSHGDGAGVREPEGRPLEILGMTSDGDLAFRLGTHPEVLTLDETELRTLIDAISRDYLPLWPTVPCRYCGTDAAVTIDGFDYCEGHAMAYGAYENGEV